MTRRQGLLRRFLDWICGHPFFGKRQVGDDPYLSGEPNETARQLVEFVGGPIDGYQESIGRADLVECTPFLSVPISRVTLQQLERKRLYVPCAPKSVATYELDTANYVWKYRFCCQVPVSSSSEASSGVEIKGSMPRRYRKC